MAVEDDAWAGLQQAQEGNAGAELVDEEGRGCELGELVGEEGDLQDEVHLAQDGAEDGEAAKHGGRNERVAPTRTSRVPLRSGSSLSDLLSA